MEVKTKQKAKETKAILPEEVLEKVFTYLADFDDLISVSKTCKQFERILLPTKTTWLFHEVLPIIFRGLDHSDILNCRLVCHFWKLSISNHVDNHSGFRTYNPISDKQLHHVIPEYQETLKGKGFTAIELDPDEHRGGTGPEAWLIKYGDHTGCPFILKYVKTCSADYETDRQYWTQTFAFLRKFGEHILYFKMLFQDRDGNMLSFYKTLRYCLQFMPNLRTLDLNRAYRVDKAKVLAKHPYFYKLKEYIKRHPLPEMPSLSSLCILIDQEDFSIFHEQIVNEVCQRYQQQLRKLKIDPDIFRNWHKGEVKNYFKSLNELHLHVSSKPEAGNKIEVFFSALHPYSDLGKLTVKFRNCSGSHNIQDIIKSLDRFSSLKILKLKFCIAPNGHNSRAQPKVELNKNVKVLSIEVHSVYGCCNFYDAILCYLPNVGYLKINHWNFYHCDKNQDDQLFEVMKGLRTATLYQSGIWSRIKSLKEIICGENSLGTVEVDLPEKMLKFTRERFEMKNKNAIKN